MKQIEQRLRAEIGLDAATIGVEALSRAVHLRLKRLGVRTTAQYRRMLATAPSEWQDLVEGVLVTESWFFREPEAFTALVRLVSGHWLPAHTEGTPRLLSLPCASGEEPYSLAIALREAGVPPKRLMLDAVDLSAIALANARRGFYRKNAFRGQDLAFRARHFRAAEGGFVLNPAVRASVRFAQGNLLDEAFASNRQPYDFIFCRNLLIYFDGPTQQRAIAQLDRLLAPGGFLFVSSAEQPVLLRNGFVSAALPQGFACQKPRPGLSGQRQPAHSQARALPVLSATPSPAPGWPAHLPGAVHSDKLDGVSPGLEQAQRLADAGRLAEAAALCEAHLRHTRASAGAYYLLGLVRDARGDASAGDCYRKALYLEPNHYESLLQLALLAQKNGDTAGARAFKRRAERVKAAAANP